MVCLPAARPAARRFPAFALLCGLALLSLLFSSRGSSLSVAGGELKHQVATATANRPLSFEVNRGQTDKQVKYLARGRGYTLFLTEEEAVLKLASIHPPVSADAGRSQASQRRKDGRDSVLRMRLVGANSRPRMAGVQPFKSKVNYFLGSDPKKWQADVPVFERVQCDSVYPGVDLVYYGNQDTLEYDFVVAPGADPEQIRLAYTGQDRMALDPSGDLVLTMGADTVRQQRPVVYQEVGSERRTVEGSYRLSGSEELTFELGLYDPSLPLVIDPVLGYSTYLGGSNEDYGGGIAVDSAGSIYVTGYTSSVDFPQVGPYQSYAGGVDVFVTKFGQNAAGVGIVYSTFLGGSGDDFVHSQALAGHGIAVDAAGIAYVTGYTHSGDFPTLGGFQSAINGTVDAFVTKLDTNIHGVSSLLYSTYLGGSGVDRGYAIAVDASANAYVTGVTVSTDFPTLGALQSNLPLPDAFVTRLDTNLTGPASALYSTYLGGNDGDIAYGIAADNSGGAYVSGTTSSADFPVMGAFQPTRKGPSDAFVTHLDTTAVGPASLHYSTYLGGSDFEEGYGIAVDLSSIVYLTGYTESTDFPTLGAFQGNQPQGDAYVAKLDPNLSGAASLQYSTYLGGDDLEVGYGIAVETAGRVYITGGTRSSDYPSSGAIQPHAGFPGTLDAMVTKLDTTATGAASLLYSTFLGGSGDEVGEGIAVNGSGHAVVAGWTRGTDFPVSPNRFQGDQPFADVFVSRIVAGANTMMLSGGSYSVPEAGTPMLNAASHGVLITVNRAGDTTAPVSVAYATEDGTAMAGMDYSATSGRLTFEGGETSKSFLVPIMSDAGLEGSELFRFTLSNPVGASLAEPATAIVTIEDDPKAPAPVRLGAMVTSTSSVQLTWTDMCVNESDFGLERSTDGGATWPEVESVPASMGTGMAVVKSLTGLASKTSYSFRVRARTASANSDYSNVVVVTRPLPVAPARFGAEALSASEIELTWEDRSGGDAAFRIERQTGEGAFDQVFNTPRGATSYDDLTVGPNTTYTYRIRAESDAVASDWAPPASATTPRKVGGLLELKPTALDFGTVRVRKSKQLSLVIRNASKTEDLRIEVKKPARPFSVTKGKGVVVLSPGGTRKVVVRFRPTQRRKYISNLEIANSGGPKPKLAPLAGVGR